MERQHSKRAGFVARLAVVFVFFAAPSPSLAGLTTLPAAPPTQASYDVGSLHVDEYGTPGKPALIFIPGLGCGPWVWFGVIAHFAPNNTIYALTLPGFDGRPSITTSSLFAAVSADFWRFLDQHHVSAPILIGHSLGGALSLLLAEQNPQRLRAVVSVDGLPVLPGYEQLTFEQRAARAAQIAQGLAGDTHAQFDQYEEQQVMPYLVGDTAVLAEAARQTARSDPKAVAQWLSEDVTTDLRPGLSKITIPVLVVAPYDAALDSRIPGINGPGDKEKYYASLLKGAPNVTVRVISGSRHFVMFDQPELLDQTISSFLKGLP